MEPPLRHRLQQQAVDRKSGDFVICDPATLRPWLVIELDDSTHARPDRQTRDDQVDAVLEAAGLPMIRVLTSRTYDTRELEAAIGPHLQPSRDRIASS